MRVQVFDALKIGGYDFCMGKKERPIHTVQHDGGCWPTQQQELLIQASVLRGKAAVDAWRQWKANVDWDQIDLGSRRLFPLAYRNLSTHGLKDPLMNIFGWVYRSTQSGNQGMFARMSDILNSFHHAGIPTLLLKGAALILLHYKDPGLRPMVDFDILVPTAKAAAAIKMLSELGWASTVTRLKGFSEIGSLTRLGWTPNIRPTEEFTQTYFSVRHAHEFVGPAGHVCDLHWHLFQGSANLDADHEFWQGAVGTTVGRVPTFALNPTDLLFHVCVHGAKWNSVPPLRWLADAATIMSTSEAEINWDRLIALARQHGQVLPLRHALAYLRRHLYLPVPSAVLKAFQDLPVSQIMRMEYRIRTRPPRLMDGFLEIYFLYKCYTRQDQPLGLFRALKGFPEFLQHVFGMERLCHLPLYVLFELVRRFREMTISFWNRAAKL